MALDSSSRRAQTPPIAALAALTAAASLLAAPPLRGWSPPSSWLPAAMCVHRGESPSGWHTNTGNGFYGGMQFSLRTWTSSLVGGHGLPSDASPREQLYRAWLLWRVYGWAPWPLTSRACGLR
jgi:resuscitation-promoting factor RpfA